MSEVPNTPKTKLPPRGSQARTIYDHLLQGGSLTSADAWDMFGIQRLPNRISEMRNKYHIKFYDKEHRKGKAKWLEYSLFPLDDA